MTINITIATRNAIFQCADYQVTDFDTGAAIVSPRNQKIQFTAKRHWHASVCYHGFATYRALNVSSWLAQRIGSITFDDPLNRLVEELQSAGAFLQAVPVTYDRRLAFTIGAFDKGARRVLTVSNYRNGAQYNPGSPYDTFETDEIAVSDRRTLVSGSGKTAFSNEVRWRLANLAATSDTAKVFNALAEAVRIAAKVPGSGVSDVCFTTFVSKSGQFAGFGHGIAMSPEFQTGLPMGDLGPQFWRRFGPSAGIRQFFGAFTHTPTKEECERRLNANPDDPDAMSDVAGYLISERNYVDAEPLIARALSANSNHVGALHRHAIVLTRKGRHSEAKVFYEQALALNKRETNLDLNYADCLMRGVKDYHAARAFIKMSRENNPSDVRWIVLHAELHLLQHNYQAALKDLETARSKGAAQSQVETNYAIALHGSGAPPWTSVGAYRTALAITPDDPHLTLNLAQLLFSLGQLAEARTHLSEATSGDLELNARVEAAFYALAHTDIPLAVSIDKLVDLLRQGGRLDWDVSSNIAAVGRTAPEKGQFLERIAEHLRNPPASEALTVALETYIAMTPSRGS
jgi:Flp pilus assembly protein TadD